MSEYDEPGDVDRRPNPSLVLAFAVVFLFGLAFGDGLGRTIRGVPATPAPVYVSGPCAYTGVTVISSTSRVTWTGPKDVACVVTESPDGTLRIDIGEPKPVTVYFEGKAIVTDAEGREHRGE